MKKLATFLVLCTLSVFAITQKPETYQYKGWNHVKTMVIYDKKHPLYEPFGGIHHVYANDKALKTIKEKGKRKFPKGAIIAFLLYEHVESKGAYTEGRKKIEAFMVKDPERYRDTGGWGFFAYDGKGKSLVKDMKRDCFSCHAQVKAQDYVFSTYKE